MGAFGLDTAIFEQLWNQRWEEGRANRQQTWDAGAADWDRKLRQKGVRKTQGEARVRDTVAYLRQRGVLGADTDTADIGCGPGRFTAAWRRRKGRAPGPWTAIWGRCSPKATTVRPMPSWPGWEGANSFFWMTPLWLPGWRR